MAQPRVVAIVTSVIAALTRRRKPLRTEIEKTPPLTLVDVSEEEFRAFVELKVQEFPPAPYQLPDGRVVVASPWMLMLPFVDGGEVVLKRYERAMKG